MKRKYISWISIALISSSLISVSSCKKGEGDPFISLKTRKSRMAGEWTLSAGSSTDKITSGTNTTTETYTYDGANVTQSIVVNSGPASTASWAHTEKWVFDKDGTYSITFTDSNQTYTAKGNWDFTQGTGKDRKRKEELVLYLTSETYGGNTTTYTGTAYTDIYDIYQLKNKEIILKQTGTFSYSGQNEEYTSEMTFNQ